MKLILILSLLTVLISCKNVQKNVDKQDAIVEDSCHQLSKKVNYHAKSIRYRTINFAEGADTFRIVPDTTGHVYVQKKMSAHCWKTLAPFLQSCNNLCRVELIDWDEDGFKDLCRITKWEIYIDFYDPKTKGFGEFGKDGFSEVNCPRYALPDKVKYNIFLIRPNIATHSYLSRFEKSGKQEYAMLRVLHEDFDTEEKPIKPIIELYSVKDGGHSLIQKWELNEFPAFMKAGGFDADGFIKDYWTKNWKKFVRD
jgi:hypothetical protein